METLISHISTHSERSAEDRSAVTYLESVLSPGGKINTSFGKDDKWPNHDGMFEYVSNPDRSRRPEQVIKQYSNIIMDWICGKRKMDLR